MSKPVRTPGSFRYADELGLVNGQQALDGLDLDDQLAQNDNFESIPTIELQPREQSPNLPAFPPSCCIPLKSSKSFSAANSDEVYGLGAELVALCAHPIWLPLFPSSRALSSAHAGTNSMKEAERERCRRQERDRRKHETLRVAEEPYSARSFGLHVGRTRVGCPAGSRGHH
jgi:hypothetical protein